MDARSIALLQTLTVAATLVAVMIWQEYKRTESFEFWPALFMVVPLLALPYGWDSVV